MRVEAVQPRPGKQAARQSGQALVELLVAMLSMTALALAVVWLGRFQDAALQAEHGAHRLAFLGARGDTLWTNPTHTLTRLTPLPPAAQPAGAHMHAAALRRDWEVTDGGGLQVVVRLQPVQATGFQLPAWPALERRAVMLTGTGHASGDEPVRQRLANADVPWAQAAAVSYGLARQVTEFMMPVDQPWGRTAPDDEWLSRWQGRVPPWHLDAPGSAP